jgi:hypothetical protein
LLLTRPSTDPDPSPDHHYDIQKNIAFDNIILQIKHLKHTEGNSRLDEGPDEVNTEIEFSAM